MINKLTILLPLVISLIKCTINTNEGKFGYSYSLQDATKREVFIDMIAEDIEINDSLRINYIWRENEWTYQHDPNLSNKTDGTQIILEFEDDKMLDNYMKTWKIVNKGNPLKGLGKVGDRSCYIDDTESLRDTFYI